MGEFNQELFDVLKAAGIDPVEAAKQAASAPPTEGTPITTQTAAPVGLNAALASAEFFVPLSGNQIILAANGEVIDFASEAASPFDEAEKYDRGWISVDSLGVFDARCRRQGYGPTTGREGKFLVVELRMVCGPKTQIGWVQDGGQHVLDWRFGRTNLNGRELSIYAQTMGAKEGPVEALRAFFAARGWIEPHLDIPAGDPLFVPKSELVWRLAPPTGVTNGRAHFRTAISKAVKVSEMTLRANLRNETNPDPYTDPLAGILSGVTEDLRDAGTFGPIPGVPAAEMDERKTRIGTASTALTGLTYPRTDNAIDYTGRRMPKRGDMPEVVIDGTRFRLLQDTDAVVQETVPA